MKKTFNLLFVCFGNVQRSPTFERVMKELTNDLPGIQIKSSGTYSHSGYGYPLTKELCEWADLIFPMELENEVFIIERWPEFRNKIHVVGIGDHYDVDDEKLVDLIHYWYNTKFNLYLFK